MMPRITDARREARRRQIARAALRCFERDGMERTSIAAVSAESGLSAGSIYVHYKNKAELVQTVAAEVLGRRVEELSAYAVRGRPPSPDELITLMTAAVTREEARFGLQVWGEATTDPALREIFFGMAERVASLIQMCCAGWLTKTQGRTAVDADQDAAFLTAHISTLYQGFLVRKALFDEPGDPPMPSSVPQRVALASLGPRERRVP